MAFTDKKIVWSLDAQTQKLTAKLDELQNRFTATGGKGFDAFKLKLAAGITGATLALTRLVSVASEFISLSDKQVAANVKVQQAVKSTGAAAGISADELQRVASGLQELTAIGDEDILKSVTAQLLTFTNISQDNFLKTQQAVLDVASVLSNDLFPSASELKAVSLQLGKALNDPISNLGALSRSGIQFSADQKETIKALAETNRLAEAQGIILDELQKQYGGQAKAAADAVGQLKKAENAYSDLKETIGALLKDAIKPAASAFKTFAETTNDFIKQSISEKLEDERVELNSLVFAIQSTNDNQELRNDLIDELQQKYPDFLGNISAESISNGVLADKIKEANDELLNRIIIQEKLEDKQNILEEQKDAWNAQYEAVKRLNKNIFELSERYNVTIDKNLSYREQVKLLDDALVAAGKNIKGFNSEQKRLQQDLNSVIIRTNQYAEVTEKLKTKDIELIEVKRALGLLNKSSVVIDNKLLVIEQEYVDTIDDDINKTIELIEKRQSLDKSTKDHSLSIKNLKDAYEDLQKKLDEIDKNNETDTFDTEQQKWLDREIAIGNYKMAVEQAVSDISQYNELLSKSLVKAFENEKRAITEATDLEERYDAFRRYVNDTQDKGQELINFAGNLGVSLTKGIDTEGFKGALKQILVTTLDFLEKEFLAAQVGAGIRAILGDVSGLFKIAGITALFETLKVSIASFRSGVENYEGGIAKVHKDELITNLPAGANVHTKAETEKLFDMKPLIKEIRVLINEVRTLQRPVEVIKGETVYRMYNQQQKKLLSTKN